MKSCTLRPPNLNRLSGDAISGFVQQKRLRRDWFVGQEPVNASSDVMLPQMECPSQNRIIAETTTYSTESALSRIKQVDGENLERQTDQQDEIESPKNQVTPQTEGLLVPQTTITVEVYQRELRRKKQVRYRKKQKNRMLQLDKDNRRLELEIQGLKTRLSAFLAPSPPQNIWSSATQFFQILKRSLRGSDVSTDKAILDMKTIVDAPDVIFNGERGVESMCQTLKHVSLWFERPEFEIRNFVEGSTNSLEATTTLSITITEKTLGHVFLHLCAGKRGASLGKRLVGKRIAVCMATRFEWDTMRSRISSVVMKSDLMQPMLKLLGNSEDVCRVFEKATMSLDLHWK